MTIALLMVTAFVVAPILNGWALSVAWGWFVSPLFSLPNLSIPAAVGLTLTLQLVIRPEYDEERYKNMEMGEVVGNAIARAVLGPLFAIGFGWVVKLFL